MNGGADNVVRSLIGVSDVARKLSLGNRVTRKRKRNGNLVAVLDKQSGEINRPGVKSRACSGFEPADFKPQPN
jgi:hypothetical protein